MEIVWQLNNNGQTSNVKMDERIPRLESILSQKDGLAAVSALSSPRIFMTHLPHHLIPKGNDGETIGKHIYVARNPKDVVVSEYNHWVAQREEDGHRPWEWYLRRFMEGKTSKETVISIKS